MRYWVRYLKDINDYGGRMNVMIKIRKFRKTFFLILIISLTVVLSSSSNKHKTQATLDTKNELLVLEHGNLIDGTGAVTKSNITIFIEGDKIKQIGSDKETNIPSGAKVIDLEGTTVLPGFINAHVHKAYDEENLQNWAKSGVTTVRDLNPRGIDNFTKKRDELNTDTNNASIVSGSNILKVQGGYGYGNAIVSSPQNAEDLVFDYINKGTDIIKFSIEDNLPPGYKWKLLSNEEIKSIVKAAHSKNKKVSVHLSQTKYLGIAIDAGVDDLAHMVVDPLNEDTIKKIIDKNIYWVPTLELWNGVGWGSIAIDNLAKFYNAGGKIALGTDFAGYSMNFDTGFPITEVKLMKQAGMSNMDIIIAATKNAAFVCDIDKKVGTLEVGKTADILVVDGDPLKDITTLSKTKMVIHNGKIVKN